MRRNASRCAVPDDNWTPRVVRFGWWLGLLLVALIVASTVARATGAHWLPHAIVATRNGDRTFETRGDTPARELSALGVSRQLRVTVGPPAASLSVWIVEPPAGAPHATVLMLHGLHDQKTSLLAVSK